MPEPTLEDDELALAKYARALGDAVEAVALDWLHRLVEQRSPGLTAELENTKMLRTGAIEAVTELRTLLAMDIADQPIGPLELLRRAVRVPSLILATANVTPAVRDGFAALNFPDDLYDLTPASFAEIDRSLHEPGLRWGAAKAHVHLRRRRDG